MAQIRIDASELMKEEMMKKSKGSADMVEADHGHFPSSARSKVRPPCQALRPYVLKTLRFLFRAFF